MANNGNIVTLRKAYDRNVVNNIFFTWCNYQINLPYIYIYVCASFNLISFFILLNDVINNLQHVNKQTDVLMGKCI